MLQLILSPTVVVAVFVEVSCVKLFMTVARVACVVVSPCHGTIVLSLRFQRVLSYRMYRSLVLSHCNQFLAVTCCCADGLRSVHCCCFWHRCSAAVQLNKQCEFFAATNFLPLSAVVEIQRPIDSSSTIGHRASITCHCVDSLTITWRYELFFLILSCNGHNVYASMQRGVVVSH